MLLPSQSTRYKKRRSLTLPLTSRVQPRNPILHHKPLETTKLSQLILQGSKTTRLYIKENMSEIAFEDIKVTIASLDALKMFVDMIFVQKKSPRLFESRIKFAQPEPAGEDKSFLIFDRIIRSIDYYTCTESYETLSLLLRARSSPWGESVLSQSKEMKKLYDEKLETALCKLSSEWQEQSLKKYLKISRREFLLAQKYSEKPVFAQHCPRMADFCRMLDNATWFVIDQILSHDTPERRSEMIEKFILLADRCYRLGNFILCMGILGGIEHSVIDRLSLTWEQVPEELRAIKNNLAEKFDPKNNYEFLQKEMTDFGGIRIPFLNPFFTSWTKLPDSLENHLEAMQELAFKRKLAKKEKTQLEQKHFKIQKRLDDQDCEKPCSKAAKQMLSLEKQLELIKGLLRQSENDHKLENRSIELEQMSNQHKLAYIRVSTILKKSAALLLQWQHEGKKTPASYQPVQDTTQKMLHFHESLASESELNRLSEKYYEISKSLEPASPTSQTV